MKRLLQRVGADSSLLQPVWHAPAFSAQRRAHFLNESGHFVAKAVLVMTDQCPLLALTSAACRIDFDALKALAKADSIRIATLTEANTLFPGCDAGSVPGFGRPFHLPTFVDQRLFEAPYLLVPTDRRCVDYRLAPDTFLRIECPIVGDFARPAQNWVEAPPKHPPIGKSANPEIRLHRPPLS